VFRIRRATAPDAASLARLAERTFRDAFAKDNTPEDLDAHTTRYYGEAQQRAEIESADVITIVADDEGKLIAYAQVRRAPTEHGEVEIARFYVEQSHHGRGVAQSLMNAAYEAGRELGGETIWLGVWERNPRAIAFYAKCGFRDVGSHPFLVGSDLQTDRILSRAIGRK
jgi:diamine N-acetyltransferase